MSVSSSNQTENFSYSMLFDNKFTFIEESPNSRIGVKYRIPPGVMNGFNTVHGGFTFTLIEKAAEEEYRRLLYVGMTRAADRLILCGYRPEKDPTYDHWYSMVEKGLLAPTIPNNHQGRLEEVGRTEDTDSTPGGIRRWVIDNDEYREKIPKIAESSDLTGWPPIPNWASPMPRELPAPRPLSPSGVLQMLNIGQEAEFSFAGDGSLALDRGNAVHHLLQILPDTDPSKHQNLIENYFRLSGAGFEAQTIADITTRVQAVLGDPANSILFGNGTRAEVELSGKVTLGGRTHSVRGKIDRLVVGADRVIIADYKTNRMVPGNANAVSADYVAQMALYRELVAELHPDKTVECHILWIENGSLMALPGELLDRQISALNTPVH